MLFLWLHFSYFSCTIAQLWENTLGRLEIGWFYLIYFYRVMNLPALIVFNLTVCLLPTHEQALEIKAFGVQVL